MYRSKLDCSSSNLSASHLALLTCICVFHFLGPLNICLLELLNPNRCQATELADMASLLAELAIEVADMVCIVAWQQVGSWVGRLIPFDEQCPCTVWMICMSMKIYLFIIDVGIFFYSVEPVVVLLVLVKGC